MFLTSAIIFFLKLKKKCRINLECCVYLFTYQFWLHPVARGISVPRPGTEPATPALNGGLSHGIAREVPVFSCRTCSFLRNSTRLPSIN